MITYKGQKTVIGKKFMLENQVVKYMGKIYGNKHLFESNEKLQYILEESELKDLKEYSNNINSKKSNLIKDIDANNKLKNLIIDYTEKELQVISDLQVGKETDINKLNDLYKKEYNELKDLNKYDLQTNNQTNISLDAQQNFLNEVNRNISEINIITLLVSLITFTKSNENRGDELNGDIQ